MSKINLFFVELFRKYTPDAFVFVIGATFFVAILAMLFMDQSLIQVTLAWGDGFWDLLAFTMQIALVLALCYLIAITPFVDRILDKIASKVHSPRTAVIIVTLAGCIGAYINWGFGAIIGGLIGRKLAMNVKGVHYPLIIAAGFSGMCLYGLGISATIPLTISTKGHPFEEQIGIIPLTETIFSLPMLITTIIVIVTLPILNALLHPKQSENIIELDDQSISNQEEASATSVNADSILGEDTIANKLNNSKLLGRIIGVFGIGYMFLYFSGGGALDINAINFIFLFLGILLLGSPMNFISKLTKSVKTITGVILQYPFYAGIMGILTTTGLVSALGSGLANITSAESLPFAGLISGYFINIIAPSAGGQWAIQGPIMIDAANALGASYAQTAMSVMLGDAWNTMVQPFWLIPILAISGLKLKDIMGYLVIPMLWVGLIFISSILWVGYLG